MCARTDDQWETTNGGTAIKTIAPLGYDVLINGQNKYLNFNVDIGPSGYGFRDNAGVMEFKNSGDAWTPVGTGTGGAFYKLDQTTPQTVTTGVHTSWDIENVDIDLSLISPGLSISVPLMNAQGYSSDQGVFPIDKIFGVADNLLIADKAGTLAPSLTFSSGDALSIADITFDIADLSLKVDTDFRSYTDNANSLGNPLYRWNAGYFGSLINIGNTYHCSDLVGLDSIIAFVPSGSTIELGEGNYILPTTAHITKQIHFIGKGKEVTNIFVVGDVDMFILNSGAAYTTFQNLSLYKNTPGKVLDTTEAGNINLDNVSIIIGGYQQSVDADMIAINSVDSDLNLNNVDVLIYNWQAGRKNTGIRIEKTNASTDGINFNWNNLKIQVIGAGTNPKDTIGIEIVDSETTTSDGLSPTITNSQIYAIDTTSSNVKTAIYAHGNDLVSGVLVNSSAYGDITNEDGASFAPFNSPIYGNYIINDPNGPTNYNYNGAFAGNVYWGDVNSVYGKLTQEDFDLSGTTPGLHVILPTLIGTGAPTGNNGMAVKVGIAPYNVDGASAGVSFLNYDTVNKKMYATGIVTTFNTYPPASNYDINLLAQSNLILSDGSNYYDLTARNIKATSGDIFITDSSKGIVMKDTQATPHYWRYTVGALGVLVPTDLGTTYP